MTSRRTVLITGGAGGIGRGIAERFHQLGDQVVVADLERAGLVAASEQIGCAHAAMDITDADSVASAVREVESRFGPVDVLINNAGVLNRHGALVDLDAADMELILRTNVLGTFLVTQHVAHRMIATGRAGSIVNLSSIGGRQPTPGMGGYESSKAAVDSLTRWAAIELAEHGIRVNAVAPGPVATAMLEAGMPEGSPQREAWESRIPLGRLAHVSDVAEAAVFLAGTAGAHLTGVSLPVDGGQLLT